MRPLLLSLALCVPALHAARAQDADTGGNVPQLPVGQVFKQFEVPDYENGKLKATFYAVEAKGITLNRAETTDLRINIFDTNAKGDKTTITSPSADLYVAEKKMRTKNTVKVENSDMTATSQECDFDLKTKKYLLRTNVKVILRHFDLAPSPAATKSGPGTEEKTPPASSEPGPAATQPAILNATPPMPPSPGPDGSSAPVLPSPSETK